VNAYFLIQGQSKKEKNKNINQEKRIKKEEKQLKIKVKNYQKIISKKMPYLMLYLFTKVETHILHNIIVLLEVTRQYLFNLRIITYGL
jgi:hypothetical protein